MSGFVIIKEIAGSLCIVRGNSYGSSLEYFGMLAAAAREDFPELEDSQLEVKHYAGERYKRTFGLEFRLPDGREAPASYHRISQPEMTL